MTIGALLARGDLAPVRVDDSRRLAEVRRLYALRASHAAWIDPACKPTVQAAAALDLIGQAAVEGLDPRQYAAHDLAATQRGLTDAGCATLEAAARFDVALSAAFLRFVRHLHLGRVDPRALKFRVTTPPDDHDFAALLQEAIEADRVREMAAGLTPALPQYERLREMLARYRMLAADPALVPFRADAKAIRPGDRAPHLGALAAWLVAAGDLSPADASSRADADAYVEPLVGAIVKFQTRHGLIADGVIGRETLGALATPFIARARQIELALERLRWLPHPADRVVVVNIPMFRLWAVDVVAAVPSSALDMGVIVGKALNTQTPVFDAWMTHVIFRPYWNVPRSILRNELLPRIRRDRSYLARNDLEIVNGDGDDAVRVAPTPDTLDRLAAGALRLRQRPGPDNSLGLIKFVFPNTSDVYLHDTPARNLFQEPRRDFSHGCVRVERPLDLAEWVFAGDPAWTRERIRLEMEGSPSHRVDLARPVQVLLFYLTAIAAPPDGTLHFARDIYGHDARLERALAAAGARPVADF